MARLINCQQRSKKELLAKGQLGPSDHVDEDNDDDDDDDDDDDTVEEGLNCGSRWALGINGPRRPVKQCRTTTMLEKSPNMSSKIHPVKYT